MSKFKVGDRVYGILEGEGRVTSERGCELYPIVVLFATGKGDKFTPEGKSIVTFLNPDLLTIEEARAKGYNVPKQKIKKTTWLNVYRDYFSAHVSKGNADTYANPGRLDCVEVTFEHEVEE